MTVRSVLGLALSVLAGSVALAGESAEEACPFDRDRAAILAMAGPYRVDFKFQETVGVGAGYELKKPYHAEARELVEVVEDEGTRIVLQHLLVVRDDDGNEQVIKHWRQDWTYEDTDVLAFRGDRTWGHVTLSDEEAKGTWTQAVYQVDDSPRYESIGRWTHLGERSAWESGETWRPLPRREYSKRQDYDVLVAKNRHTVTPAGWVHEQDNHKLVLDGDAQPLEVLAHESGLNVYDRDDTIDFSAGRLYWEQTAAYWQDVREVWDDVLGAHATVTLHAKVDGQRLHRALFALAEGVVGDGDAQRAAEAAGETVRAFVAVDPQ